MEQALVKITVPGEYIRGMPHHVDEGSVASNGERPIMSGLHERRQVVS
jgi:hypothetical protein